MLEAALKERGDDPPPVEELLLAWAYLDTDQADKAKALWAKLKDSDKEGAAGSIAAQKLSGNH